MTLASRWTRRNALRAGSAGLALPALESLAQGADDAATTPTRLVCVGTYLGFYQWNCYGAIQAFKPIPPYGGQRSQ